MRPHAVTVRGDGATRDVQPGPPALLGAKRQTRAQSNHLITHQGEQLWPQPSQESLANKLQGSQVKQGGTARLFYQHGFTPACPGTPHRKNRGTPSQGGRRAGTGCESVPIGAGPAPLISQELHLLGDPDRQADPRGQTDGSVVHEVGPQEAQELGTGNSRATARGPSQAAGPTYPKLCTETKGWGK